jgi:O-antigen ligase
MSTMRATAAPLRSTGEAGGHGWIFATAGLIALGALCGISLALGELQAFYIALTVVVGIAVMVDFRIGALLLVLVLPFGNTSYFPHNLFGLTGLNPLNLLLGTTLVSAVLHRKLAGLAPRPLIWLFVVPIMIAGVMGMRHFEDIAPTFLEPGSGLNFTDAFGYYREVVVRPLLLVLVALLVGAVVARAQKPERVLIVIMLSLWVIALTQIGFIAASGVELGMLASEQSRRFFNEIGLHANDLGRFFAGGYALLLFVWWETKSPGLKLALAVTLCVSAIALLLSFSRAAYIAFFLVNGLFLLWKFNARTGAMALLLGLFAMAFAPHYIWRRLTFGFDADANAVSADRINMIWTPLWPEVFKSPLVGTGIDSTIWSEPARAGTMLLVGHPHNAYLQAVLDMGLIGLGLLLAYYWHVWRNFRALGSNPYLTPELRGFFQGATAALLCLFVTGMSGGSLRPDVDFACLWLAIGMMYGVLARKPVT